jgi:predicted phosphate transport protein (TIGR00153 family)
MFLPVRNDSWKGENLEKWFARRRKSKVLELADRQMILATDTIGDLQKAVAAASKADATGAKTHTERLSKVEHEIDELRRTIFEELTKDSMPPHDREDIMHLVKRLDEMADHVKDAARSLDMILRTKVVAAFWEPLTEMASKLVEISRILRRAIEALGTAPPEARQLAITIDKIEGEIDEQYQRIKELLLEHSSKMTTATLLFLRDLAEEMEHVADSCDDTADYVRILAATREA